MNRIYFIRGVFKLIHYLPNRSFKAFLGKTRYLYYVFIIYTIAAIVKYT